MKAPPPRDLPPGLDQHLHQHLHHDLDQDPPRWKELPSGAPAVEIAIGTAVRLLDGARSPAGERMALAGARPRRQSRRPLRPWAPWGPAWIGRAALIGGSLILGSAAAALSGKLIQHLNNQAAERVVAPASPGAPHSARPRRSRVMAPPEPAASVESGAAVEAVDIPTATAREAPVLPPPVVASAPARPPRKFAMLEQHPSRPAPRSAPRDGDLPSVRALPLSPAANPASTVEPPMLDPRPPGEAAIEPRAPEPAPSASAGLTGAGTWVSPAVKLHPQVAPPPPTVPEAALVSRAIGRLRRDHDPVWALDDLAAHDRLYPRGKLNREVALARAEALLALDRHADALAVLDGVKLEPTLTDRRARLARAELRAHEGRRAEAIGDFDGVLAADTDDELAERALYGRAVCRVRGGDLGSARIDLRAYRERFPVGRHHADVEKILRLLGG